MRSITIVTAALVLVACGESGGADAAVAIDAGSDAGSARVDATCPMPDAALPPANDAGPPSPECEGARCGGDLEGAWEVVAVCTRGTGDASFLRCAEGTITVREFDVTGTWTFGGDGTLSVAGMERAVAQAFLPLSCYVVTTCELLASLAESAGLEAICIPSGAPGARCRAEACECLLTLDEPALMLNATYVADAAEGTFTATLGMETIEGEYCVEGDELWLHATRFGGVDYRYRMRRVAP